MKQGLCRAFINIILFITIIIVISGCATHTIQKNYTINRSCNCTPAYIDTDVLLKSWDYQYVCNKDVTKVSINAVSIVPVSRINYIDECGKVNLMESLR